MKTEKNIFDSIDLNNFLNMPENIDIVKNHFRLWAVSDNIMNLLFSNHITVDSEVLISNIKAHAAYYVETSDYRKALNVVMDKRMILLKGDPGVGKTTTSEMLILALLDKFPSGRLLYSTTNNIDSIKDNITNESQTTDLIYIDDFLGDIYLEVKKEKLNAITSLIKYVSAHENKYLILNTRCVVYNEALNININFHNAISDLGIQEIEIKNLSKYAKARILFNHLYSSKLDKSIKEKIVKTSFYKKIVEHENFNPRHIEQLSNSQMFEESGIKDYFEYCIDTLNKQLFTWYEAYKNNLAEVDRVFINVLFSLDKGSYIPETILE